MRSKLTLKAFNEFGLNTYEAKSYMSLLEKNNLTAVEVAKISGVPRARVYETLENLMEKGLCRAIPGKVKKYGAVDPIVLKDKFNIRFHEAEKELEDKKKELSQTKEDAENFIQKLVPLYKESRANKDPLDYIEVVKDPLQVHHRICQLAADANEEILVFTKHPYTVPRGDLLKQQVVAENKALKKGVLNRSIYEIPKDIEEKDNLLSDIRWLIKGGEHARVVDELPVKMAIFDEKVVVYFLEDPLLQKISLTSMIIQHRSLARVLKVAFEAIWATAHEVDDYLARGQVVDGEE